MKEQDLIEAINRATKTAQSGGFDAARAERDALLYLGGFLDGGYPRVSNALTELLGACSELRVAAKKDAT